MKKTVLAIMLAFPLLLYAQTVEEVSSLISVRDISINGLLILGITYLYRSGNQTKTELNQKIEARDLQLKEANDKIYNLQITYLTTFNDFKIALNENTRVMQENGRILEKLSDKLD